MGLICKPSSSQLMIGDFIRERKKRYQGPEDVDSKVRPVHENSSHTNLIKLVKPKLALNLQDKIKLRRRYTSKSGQKHNIQVMASESICRVPKNRSKTRSKRKHCKNGSKIKIRNPNSHYTKLVKIKMTEKRERNKSQEEFYPVYKNTDSGTSTTSKYDMAKHVPNKSVISDYHLDLLKYTGAYSRQKSITTNGGFDSSINKSYNHSKSHHYHPSTAHNTSISNGKNTCTTANLGNESVSSIKRDTNYSFY